MTFREIKRRLLRQPLHDRLAEPAWYLPTPTAEPVACTVRLHLRFDEIGQLASLQSGFADRQELTPRIVFLNSQVAPTKNGFVVTKDMGVYRVDNDLAPDDITTTAEVSTVSESRAAGFGWDPSQPWYGFTPPVL